MGYAWHPIEPLSSDWQSWADSELAAIRVAWKDLQETIGEQTTARLRERMVTEWGIETGMVEGLYRWDRTVTETLLAGGVRADRIPDGSSNWPPDLVAQVIRDQIDVAKELFSFVTSERPLGTSLVHELHAQLLRSVPREFDLGMWKVLPNAVRFPDGSVHEYCPPEHVASEMDRLLDLHEQYEREQIPVEIRAAWLHHRFTQIHPYPDGNGRVARALASLLLVKTGLFPLIIRRSEKRLYLDALEVADRGDDAALIERVRTLQRRELTTASEFTTEPALTLDETIRRLSEKLGREGRRKVHPDAAAMISEESAWQMNCLAERLSATFGGRVDFHFKTVVGSSAYLLLRAPKPWRLVCTLQGAGPAGSGLAMCVVRLHGPDAKLFVLPDSLLITYAEPVDQLKIRFNKWLEKQLITALDLWQQHL